MKRKRPDPLWRAELAAQIGAIRVAARDDLNAYDDTYRDYRVA